MNPGIETGTPTFLVDLLTARHTWLPELGRQIGVEFSREQRGVVGFAVETLAGG